MDLLFLSYTGCTHIKNSTQYMQDVGGNCLGILMEQKNSKVLEDAMGCFFLIRHERKGRDFKLIDFGEYHELCFVLCLSMPFIHKSVQTLLNCRVMHNLLHSQAIRHKLIWETKRLVLQQKNGKCITFPCEQGKNLLYLVKNCLSIWTKTVIQITEWKRIWISEPINCTMFIIKNHWSSGMENG